MNYVYLICDNKPVAVFRVICMCFVHGLFTGVWIDETGMLTEVKMNETGVSSVDS